MENSDATRQNLIVQILAAVPEINETDPTVRGIRAWEQLVAHLQPLIGEAGLCALYARTLRLASPDDAHTAAPLALRSSTVLLEGLQLQLGAMAPESAAAFNAALLDTFTKLLSGLIGEGLTTRLLNTAWADRPERIVHEP